jgi:tRNA G18 (ribose-2'-O)-methylase SpoU
LRFARQQLSDLAEIDLALRGGAPVRLMLAARAPGSPQAAALVERARLAGIPVHRVSRRELRRLGRGDRQGDLLALVGPDPQGGLDQILEAGGAAWLLVRIVYGSNAGFVLRTAEVSGADGVILDVDFDGAARREALRASMGAHRFLPVCWERASVVLDRALAAGRRVLGIEDVGDRAPWEMDLTGPVLFVVGGEKEGIPTEVLGRCQEVLRIPMAGFIPSYNLQAAVAAVAVERLRQCALARSSAPFIRR